MVSWGVPCQCHLDRMARSVTDRGFRDLFCWGCLGGMAGTRMCGLVVLGHTTQGLLWQDSQSRSMHGLWGSWGLLCQDQLGGMAGLGTAWEFLELYVSGPPLGAAVGQGPRVHWGSFGRPARLPELCSHPCYERKGVCVCRKWHLLAPLIPERHPAVLCPFGRCSRVSEWISFMYSLDTL